jgi:transcription elongation factor Elf1
MALFDDIKYLRLLSPKLERFAQKSEYLWNFRCPICNDSHKNKFKARGYIYRRKSDLFYTCHNCGESTTFGNFLKTSDASLYRQYQLDRYKNESGGNVKKPDFPSADPKTIFDNNKKVAAKNLGIPAVEELPNEHVVRRYISDRMIPRDRWNQIFYARNFKTFIDDLFPEHGKTLYDEPRIVFPFYDEKKNLLGVQGRALNNTSRIKYITIKASEDAKKVYGIDRVDVTKPIYVVEGPIDSLFLSNSIATMDATLHKITTVFGDHDYVFCYDNEPRNPEICRSLRKTIDMGKKVCIWPKNIKEKDINEMVMHDFSPDQIRSIIDSNTFENLFAMLEYLNWSKS